MHTVCSPVTCYAVGALQRVSSRRCLMQKIFRLPHPSALLLRFLCSTHLEYDLIYIYASPASGSSTPPVR